MPDGICHRVRTVQAELAAGTGRLERISTTQEHPFHVPGKGFVRAGDLSVGMAVSTAAHWKKPQLQNVAFDNDTSGFLRVKSLTLEDKTETVYNHPIPDTYTGREGLPISDYKDLWKYADGIDFGF